LNRHNIRISTIDEVELGKQSILLIPERDTTIRASLDAITAFLAVLHMCYSRLFIYLLVDSISTFFNTCPAAVTALVLDNSWNFYSPFRSYSFRVLKLKCLRPMGNGQRT